MLHLGVDVIEHVREGSHDLVIVDAFDGIGMASTWRFLNSETMRHIKVSFRDQTSGLLVFNVVITGERESDDDVLHRAASIIAQRFNYVRVFRDSPEDMDAASAIFFASDSNIDAEGLESLFEGDWKYGSEHWVVRNFHKWQFLECTPMRCESLSRNSPKSPPGKEYDDKLRQKVVAATSSYIPAEKSYSTYVKIQIQFLALVISGVIFYSLHNQPRGKTD